MRASPVRAAGPGGSSAGGDERSLVVLDIYYMGQLQEKTPDCAARIEERIAKAPGLALVTRADARAIVARSFPATTWYASAPAGSSPVAAVAAVGGGLHASYASDRATAECDPAGGACAADFSGRQAAKASAETARTGAYASFGVASAALVGGVIAFQTSEDEDPDADFTPRVDRGARASLLGASAPGGFARAALGGSSLP
ncbi:MAG: hypothetical protein U1F43_04405 [Myxococcota bacterium]